MGDVSGRKGSHSYPLFGEGLPPFFFSRIIPGMISVKGKDGPKLGVMSESSFFDIEPLSHALPLPSHARAFLLVDSLYWKSVLPQKRYPSCAS